MREAKTKFCPQLSKWGTNFLLLHSRILHPCHTILWYLCLSFTLCLRMGGRGLSKKKNELILTGEDEYMYINDILTDKNKNLMKLNSTGSSFKTIIFTTFNKEKKRQVRGTKSLFKRRLQNNSKKLCVFGVSIFRLEY